MRWRFRMWCQKQRERFVIALAWRLPRWLVYWCFIRVAAHATCGKYSATEVPSLTAMEALERWDRGDR